MKIGPFEIRKSKIDVKSRFRPIRPKRDFSKGVRPIFASGLNKSYKQLADVIAREKSASIKDPKTNPGTQLREYKSWVSSCVSLIADSVSATDYEFYNINTGEEISSSVHSYKNFAKPITSPNNLMTFSFLKEFCQTQVDMCGMSMIYKARNVFGQTIELWPLNMAEFLRCENNPNRENKLLPQVKYLFQIDGYIFDFYPEDLIILKHTHPTNMNLGASPIQQQAYAVDIQSYVEIYERDFFSNSARIDGILISDSDIEQNQADMIKSRWREKYARNYHDIAVLGSGLKFQPIEYANKDFEFLNLVQWSKELVLGAYRVPEAKLGNSSSANRSNAVYTDIYFARECLRPRLNMWDEAITYSLLKEFDPRIGFRHVDPIPRDRQLEVQEGRTYLSGVPSMTINEFRKKVHNLPPIENGDRIVIPSSYIYLDKLDKIIDNQIKVSQNKPNPATDPARHEDDDPKTNPDGSDDRDSLPTDGRFTVSDIEKELRNKWKDKLEESSDKNIFNNLVKTTILFYLKYYRNDKLFSNLDMFWVDDFSNKLHAEFNKSKQFNSKESTGRLAKILQNGVRGCNNFARYLILDSRKENKEWVTDKDVCAHSTRVKNMVSKDMFYIGDSRIRFPLENINLDCDCMVTGKFFKEDI